MRLLTFQSNHLIYILDVCILYYEYCSTYVVWILSKVQYAYYGSRVILVYLVVCAMHTLHSTRDLMHNTLGSIMHYTINLVLASSITTLE